MTHRPRLLIATPLYPPDIGGPATYSRLLFQELPLLGIDVELCVFSTYAWLPKGVRHVVYFFALLFRAFRIDAIYAQDPVSVGLPSALASMICFKPLLLKIVGDYAWEQGAQRSGVTDLLDEFSAKHRGYPRLVQILKWVQVFVARRAQAIVVPSNYLKKIVSNWGIDAEKISVVYNGFVPPRLDIDRSLLRGELGMKGTVFVSVGRLVPWKGFDTIIRLIPAIVEQAPEFRLIIIGDGPLREFLQDTAHTALVSHLVQFTGSIAQSEVYKYIKAADGLILNTSYEGLSHLLLEAMALRTPIVTTAVGGNVELIEDGRSGVLVEYNDEDALLSGIVRVSKDFEFDSRVTDSAYAKVLGFSDTIMLNKISQWLKDKMK